MLRTFSLIVSIALVPVIVGCQQPAGYWAGESRDNHESFGISSVALSVSFGLGTSDVVRDGKAEARMQRVGARLSRFVNGKKPRFSYRLIGSGQLNAISLGDGRIYVTRGLYNLLDNDDQLAAILAHEMAHVEVGDHYKPACSDQGEALDREVAADLLAVNYLKLAGITPQAMVQVIDMTRLGQNHGWSDIRCRSIAEGRNHN